PFVWSAALTQRSLHPCYGGHRGLRSFPTRRSSDLAQRAHVSVVVGDQVFQGEETTARVTFHNTGTRAKDDVTITPVVPEGWTVVSAEGTSAASVEPGGSLSATFVVSPGSGSSAGAQSVGGTATYRDAAGGERTGAGTNQIDVAYGSLAAAINHVSITSVATKDAGNFDGGGASFSEDAVAAAGATWGQPLTVQRGEDTIELVWPDSEP